MNSVAGLSFFSFISDLTAESQSNISLSATLAALSAMQNANKCLALSVKVKPERGQVAELNTSRARLRSNQTFSYLISLSNGCAITSV